jgi:hypothetical protein
LDDASVGIVPEYFLFLASSANHAYQRRTYTQQALYDQPFGRLERTGETDEPKFTVVVVPVDERLVPV